MGGGLMQLVAYGAQDVYLSGNPQITFFKVVYRRHTNFAVEPIPQTWNGASDFGRTVTCNINRNGDLITNMYVVVHLAKVPSTSSGTAWGYVNRLGHAMIENIKIEIGGSIIDEHYGDWLNIWYELTHKAGQTRGYAKMIGDTPELTDITSLPKNEYFLYIPLIFWFNRNNGLALPLIALQYHDVRITLKFRSQADCINYSGSDAPEFTNPLIKDSYLLIDYVYLDSEERKRFAQASHEYLIEQLQFTGSETITGNTGKYRLNFNHPSKYLIWAPHIQKYYNKSSWISYSVNDDWNSIRDRFAKILVLASRKYIYGSYTNPSGTRQFSSFKKSDTTIYITRPNSIDAAGDIFASADIVDNIPQPIKDLLNKVEVKFIAQETITDTSNAILIANTSNSTDTIVSQSNKLLGEILNNTIVIENYLTPEDVSFTVQELNTLSNNTLNQLILDLATVNSINYYNYGNFIDGSDNPIQQGKLQLNGHDRFQYRDGSYFNYVQPYQHWSNTPADGINVYSFALKAEDHQPTGSCNFSRIDNATLHLDFGKYNLPSTSDQFRNSNSIINIYTVNYNILRVMSGMAGVAYSN